MKRVSPICPKCRQNNTYNIIPEIANIPEIQLSEKCISELNEITSGNAKYYCIDCDYTWKKFRGRKPYEQIRV